MAEESLYSKDWFLKAEQDLRRVENLLACEDWEGKFSSAAGCREIFKGVSAF